MKIILVDDDPLIEKIISTLLKYTGYDYKLTLISSSFKDFKADSRDIIFLSLDIEGFDSFELIEKNPGPSYILLSEDEDFYKAQRALRLGAKDILLKPVDIEGFSKSIERIVGYKPIGNKVIDEIVNYINNNYNEDISLSKMAKKYYMEPGNLSRLFKNKTGVNFNDYIWEVRIKIFAELLRTSDEKISSLIEKVCSNEPATLYRNFRNKTGLTPSSYKKSLHMKRN
ncbi:AraC family transcriptional regulator [Peptoniphilus catoniae]|uniref:AraC family transcriptional regulator n=1 Tax=Peptoniphilus catoniae TaxID=1660341 RepID=UPI0010FDFFA9|nr:DNA-binding response regulator [Peptoniphilus catoniae]